MPRLIKNFIARLKLFSPVFIGIGISILIITWQSINNSKATIHESLKETISIELETITKMFERERKLKLEKVKTHLKVMHNYFYSADFQIKKSKDKITATNQISGNTHKVMLNNWVLNNLSILNNHSFVDSIQQLLGGTATIFQKIDSGYIRISTNVLTKDAKRAIGTYIPNNSKVIQAIERGNTYIGHAFVVNDWYITAYEPITYKGNIRGILYVGDKEKNLSELGNAISNIKIGKSGYIMVADGYGNIIVRANKTRQTKLDSTLYQYISKTKKGIFENNKNGQLIAFNYFKDFDLYILASINPKTETSKLINKIILESIIIGFIIMILLSAFVYFITTENIHKYLRQLNLSNKNLASTRKALNFSEQKFETLFNNSSDEIFLADLSGNFVEVNQLVCEKLGYTKDELLNMSFLDIKSQKYRAFVSKIPLVFKS